MPRLSPDGASLAFVAVPQPFGSHSTNVEVRCMEWPAADGGAGASSRVVVPKVAGTVRHGEGFAGFCGFHPQLDGLGWLGGLTTAGDAGTSLVFPTINSAELTVYACED
eukprot:2026675-Prymnesium_polylepis.1